MLSYQFYQLYTLLIISCQSQKNVWIQVRYNTEYIGVVIMNHFLYKSNCYLGRVIITTLPPISTKGLDVKDVPDLMEKTKTLMSQVFHSTNREIQLSLVSKEQESR